MTDMYHVIERRAGRIVWVQQAVPASILPWCLPDEDVWGPQAPHITVSLCIGADVCSWCASHRAYADELRRRIADAANDVQEQRA